VVVLHSIAWAIGLNAFAFPYNLRTAIAQYLSSLVLVILSTNLVLATRTHWLESAFGGLDKMFATHRLGGIVAATAILVHATIVPLTTPILPGRAVGILALLLLVGSAAFAIAPRAPWRKLLATRYETWKAEHRFMGVIVAIGAAHSLLVPTLVRAMPVVAAWTYGWVAVGLTAYAYRETWFRFWARRHAYTVAETTALGPDIIEIRLEPSIAPIAHRAGQFAFVVFDGASSRERHPFTISAAPDAAAHLRFSIKASGDFTKALQAGLPAGSAASIEGPYGRFDTTRGRTRQLWLAGGIGITPFLASLPGVTEDREITLVWSVHDAAEAVYLDEAHAACAAHSNVRFMLWTTSELGHIDLASLAIEHPKELSVYLCGPVSMRTELLGQLAKLGVALGNTHWEEFTLR
jgi:predicted ferric reductase